ncbi:MAG: hypothetical protein HeimC2_28600 [Candidatus Heimdallarchaeota archaeon LC_2]|nr:MAG: hypothetical protein HeimC2_28600 [Candidatus Heimdallarchaeota archaeon LC_2]
MMLLLSLSVWFVTSSDQLRINNSDDPGSMYPVMMEGDAFIIFDVSPDSISVGDIIVYQIFVVNIDFIDNDEYIIHRVQAKIKIEEKYYFLIKGDNYISNSNLDNPGLSPDEYESIS